MLYKKQLPPVTIEELHFYQNGNYYMPQWVQEAIDNKDILFCYGAIFIWLHNLKDYVAYVPNLHNDCEIRYEDIYGESQW